MICSHRRRAIDLGFIPVFNQQLARHYQRRDLRIAKLTQQTPHVAVQRFFPRVLAALEITADKGRANAFVHSCGIESNEPSLSITNNSNVRACSLLGKPVDGAQYLLYLQTNKGPPHHVTLTVNPFAMRLVRHDDVGITRASCTPVDERGHNHFIAQVGQIPGKLQMALHPRIQSHHLLRRLIGIGHHHDMPIGFVVPMQLGLQQQALPMHTFQHRPSHLIHLEPFSFRQESRVLLIAKPFHHHRHSLVHHANDLFEVLSVRLHRTLVGFRR